MSISACLLRRAFGLLCMSKIMLTKDFGEDVSRGMHLGYFLSSIPNKISSGASSAMLQACLALK